MALRFALLPLVLLAVGCSSTPELVLKIRVEPEGATVRLRCSGEKAYRGDFGPVEGDVRAEPFEEDFLVIGEAPLEYRLPLEELESGGTVLGFGGGVIRKYKEGVIRVEMDGFEPLDRHVRFTDGELKVSLKMREAEPTPQP